MIQYSPVRKTIAVALLAAAFGFGCAEPTPATVPIEMASSSVFVVPARPSINARIFLDEARFRAAWTSDLKPIPIPGEVVAGVVNHHILASDLLADFFRRLKLSRPDATRFIILSPDHYHAGRSAVSTHLRSYSTPDGNVPVDATSVRALIEDGFAADEPTLFEKEHGVGALVPFLRHEFPEVSVIPLAVSGSILRPNAAALGRKLAGLADDHTLVIVSSDMSHYLSETEALRNDEDTKKALNALDPVWFGKVNDDFTCNGVSFVALRAFLDARGTTPSFTQFGHSISTKYGGPKNDTTSYFTGVWSD